jgi:hypothetical protein
MSQVHPQATCHAGMRRWRNTFEFRCPVCLRPLVGQRMKSVIGRHHRGWTAVCDRCGTQLAIIATQPK